MWRCASIARSSACRRSRCSSLRLQRREPRDRDLEDLARLLQVLGRVARVAQQERHRLHHVVRRERRDERPAPHVHVDQPLLGQRLDRLAHRGAAHAKMPRQLSLGGDPVARLELSRQDLRLHVLDDLLVQSFLGANRVVRTSHVVSSHGKALRMHPSRHPPVNVSRSNSRGKRESGEYSAPSAPHAPHGRRD